MSVASLLKGITPPDDTAIIGMFVAPQGYMVDSQLTLDEDFFRNLYEVQGLRHLVVSKGTARKYAGAGQAAGVDIHGAGTLYEALPYFFHS